MEERTNNAGGVETLASGDSKKFLGEDGLTELISLVKGSTYSSGGGTTSGHTGACDGVYIAYVDYDGVKRIVEPESWSDDLGAAQGVMVGDGTHEVMFPYQLDTNTSYYFTLYEVENTAPGCILQVHSNSEAEKAFNGELNTIAELNSNIFPTDPNDECVFSIILEYAFGITGKGKWWLPSVGELKMLTDRIEELNVILDLLGAAQVELFGSKIWTSTLRAETAQLTAQTIRNGSTSSSNTNSTGNVFPATSFEYVV